jgi:hypothetical protein
MNKQIVAGIYEAFGRGDVAAVLSAMAEDVAWEMPGTAPFAGARKGHAEVQQFFVDLMNSVKIDQFNVDAIIADGERVVVLGSETCTVPATGRTVSQHWSHAYTLRDGKVTAIRLYEDTGAIASAFARSATGG